MNENNYNSHHIESMTALQLKQKASHKTTNPNNADWMQYWKKNFRNK